MRDVLRIVDANVNRVREGLRFLEDVVRFSLNDSALAAELRSLRHRVAESCRKLGTGPLGHRRAQADVGAEAPAYAADGLPALVRANSGRVQEGLRILEETAKLPELREALDSEGFRKARFAVYELEQRLLSRLLRNEKARRIRGLYAIVNADALDGGDLTKVAMRALEAGACAVELAGLARSRREMLSVARGIQELCMRYRAMLVVARHLDLALAAGVDGLRLDPEDLPAVTVRRLLPIETIVGVSVAGGAGALQAQSEGADYVLLRETPRGPAVWRDNRKALALPVVFPWNGKTDPGELFKAGADAVVVTLEQPDQELPDLSSQVQEGDGATR